MPALTAAATDSAWNAGGSLLTFYFPIGLLVLVVALLYFQFARPHTIPGRKPLGLARTGSAPATTSSDGTSAVGPPSRGTSRPGPDQPHNADTDEEPEAPKADA